MSLFSQAGYIATFFKPRVHCPYYRAVQLVFHPDFHFYTRSARGQRRHIANYYLDTHFKKISRCTALPAKSDSDAMLCSQEKEKLYSFLSKIKVVIIYKQNRVADSGTPSQMPNILPLTITFGSRLYNCCQVPSTPCHICTCKSLSCIVQRLRRRCIYKQKYDLHLAVNVT